MPPSLEVYTFVDRRDADGLFPVLDVDGRLAARIETSFWNRRFTVHGPDGGVLCAGRPYPMGRTYDVADGAGNPLFTVRSSFWAGNRRTVGFPSGGELTMATGGWFSRDWDVTDATGRVVLRLVNTASWFALHPDAFAVEVGDPALTLPVVVGLVQVNRMLVKQARSSSSGPV